MGRTRDTGTAGARVAVKAFPSTNATSFPCTVTLGLEVGLGVRVRVRVRVGGRTWGIYL